MSLETFETMYHMINDVPVRNSLSVMMKLTGELPPLISGCNIFTGMMMSLL